MFSALLSHLTVRRFTAGFTRTHGIKNAMAAAASTKITGTQPDQITGLPATKYPIFLGQATYLSPMQPSWEIRTKNRFGLPFFFSRSEKFWFTNNFLPRVFNFILFPFTGILLALGVTKSKASADTKETDKGTHIKKVRIFSDVELNTAKETIKAFNIPIRPEYIANTNGEGKQKYFNSIDKYNESAKNLYVLCDNQQYSINFSYSYFHHRKEYEAIRSGLEAHAEEHGISDIDEHSPAYLITLKSKNTISGIALGIFDNTEKPNTCLLTIESTDQNIDRFQQLITQITDDLNKKQIKTLYLSCEADIDSDKKVTLLNNLGFTVTTYDGDIVSKMDLDPKKIEKIERNKKIDPDYDLHISNIMEYSKAEELFEEASESLNEISNQNNSNTISSASAERFGIFIKNKQGDNLGGVCCSISNKVLYVDMLWLSKEIRNKNASKPLIELAEIHATSRGCTEAFLETEERYAPWLYPKCGYEAKFPVQFGPNTFYYFGKELEKSKDESANETLKRPTI